GRSDLGSECRLVGNYRLLGSHHRFGDSLCMDFRFQHGFRETVQSHGFFDYAGGRDDQCKDCAMRVFVLLLAFCASALGQGFPFPGGHTAHGGGGVSWAFSQVACSTNTGCPNPNLLNCGSSATTCTATFSAALSAGDTLIIPEFGPASTTPDSITVTGGGTVVGP